MTKLLVALFFLGLNGYVYWFMGSEEVTPPRHAFAEFPNQLGDWKCAQRDVLDDEILNNLKLTDYVSCNFFDARENEAVSFRLFRISLSRTSRCAHFQSPSSFGNSANACRGGITSSLPMNQ